RGSWMLDMLRGCLSHRTAAGRGCAPAGALLLGLGLAASPAAAAAITGVCPDGSVFIVQRAADVPCRDAKRVEPHQVPPLRPENLPRAYLWQVHREGIDENNPYNLVDRAEQVRAMGASGAAPGDGAGVASTPSGSAVPPQVAAAPPIAPAAAPRSPTPADLGLTDGELRDLFYLVELSQQQAPATFLRAGAGGEDSLRLAFAHSQAFEQRVRAAGAGGAGGPVLLFSAQPRAHERFVPNFTFVQGHLTFTPRRDDPSQLGVL